VGEVEGAEAPAGKGASPGREVCPAAISARSTKAPPLQGAELRIVTRLQDGRGLWSRPAVRPTLDGAVKPNPRSVGLAGRSKPGAPIALDAFNCCGPLPMLPAQPLREGLETLAPLAEKSCSPALNN